MNDLSLTIFDTSICPKPKIMGQRVLLCDEMWQAIDWQSVELLLPVKHYLEHLVYTQSNQTLDDIIDGSYLNILDDKVYAYLSEIGLFAKFRATFYNNLSDFDKTLAKEIKTDINDLIILGWEVVDNCGCSASYEGIYPLNSYFDYFYINNSNYYNIIINKFGLFDNLEYAQVYCQLNNKHNQDNAPWIPVAILTDKLSKEKISLMLNQI